MFPLIEDFFNIYETTQTNTSSKSSITTTSLKQHFLANDFTQKRSELDAFSYSHPNKQFQYSKIPNVQRNQIFPKFDINHNSNNYNSKFCDSKPFSYDECNQNGSVQFSPQFFNDPCWKPLCISKTETEIKETTSSESKTYTTNDPYLISSVTSEQQQLTPRAIRKTGNPIFSSSKKKDENLEKSEQSTNGILWPKPANQRSSNSLEAQTINSKKKNQSRKFSYDKSNGLSSIRQLPMRSKNIDLSSFLKKDESMNINEDVEDSGMQLAKIKQTTQLRCNFCINNGEKAEVYMSHTLKDSLGKILCPILREYTCPKCGESGDYAHTNNYCPETQRKQKEYKIRQFNN